MRIAIGPFPNAAHDQWPVYGHKELAPDFEIVPFHVAPTSDADATIHWSPEYNPTDGPIAGYRVAVYGDHHVVPFEKYLDLLRDYHLVCADYRGVKRLRELGIDALYFRQFSFDPRLHSTNIVYKRDIAVSFLGRPVPERHPYLMRIVEWGKSTGNPVYVTTDPYERGKEAHYYQRSKIVWTKSQRSELPMRVYESAACGALALIELDNAELYQSGAPLAGWTDSLLEAQLDEWVRNDAAREAKVREQYAWVQRETPARHLRYLCEQIRERMEQSDAISIHARGRHSGAVGEHPPSTDRMADTGLLLASVDPTPPDYSQIDPPENERREEVCALVPMEAKTILDLGCHQGGLLHHLRKTRAGLYTVGVDLDPRSRERCVHRMDEYHEYDLEQYRGYNLQPWGKRKYDCIITADVLEHVKDPWGVVGALRDLLAPGGCIVASIPNIRNTAVIWHYLRDAEWRYHVHSKDVWRGPQDNCLAVDHIRFFCREGVLRLFADAGFRVDHLSATYLSAPGLEGWTKDLGDLIAKHGGSRQGWDEDSHVIQWLVVARR